MEKSLEYMLPTSFVSLDLGAPVDENKAREAIHDYAGHIVLISDSHACVDSKHGKMYLMGTVRPDPEIEECYTFERIGSDTKLRFHYNDLQAMMAIAPLNLHVPIKLNLSAPIKVIK